MVLLFMTLECGSFTRLSKPDRPTDRPLGRLLQTSYGWQEIYKAATDVEEELRRLMNPGAAGDGGHW